MRRFSLKGFRADCNMTIREVANATGFATSTICRWESGEASPTYQQLTKLCELYKCSPDEVRFIVPEESTES